MKNNGQRKAFELRLAKHLNWFFAPGLLREAAFFTLFPGGKRIRPLLALTIGKGVAAPENKTLDFASALELIHNYTLIHDDLPAMDNDNFRRGKPSAHKKFGEACAILLGDALLTHAFELLGALKNEGVNTLVARAIGGRGVILGQILDLNIDGKKNKGLVTLKEINRLKTAELFRAAIVGAAMLSPRPIGKIAMKNFSSFARLFGACFQLADDLADQAQESAKKITTLATAKTSKNAAISLSAGIQNLNTKISRLPLPPSSKTSLVSITGILRSSIE